MALIICPECGKEVSDKSEVCIHCGYPLVQKPGYSLVLKKDIMDREKTVAKLCEKYGYEPADAEKLIDSAPCVIKSGMSMDQAKECKNDFLYIAWTRILSDEDAEDPTKLDSARENPMLRRSAPPPPPPVEEPKKGLGFGGTVFAVILGVIAAILILSIF